MQRKYKVNVVEDDSTCESCDEINTDEEKDEYEDWDIDESDTESVKSEDSDEGYSSSESIDTDKKVNILRDIRKSLNKMTNVQKKNLQTRLSRPKETTRRNIWKD